MYNIYFYTIIAIYIIFFVFDKVVDYLNTLNWSDELPEEAKWIYDEEKYKKSQDYEKTKFSFSKITSIFSFIIMLLMLIFWWFGLLDIFLRTYISNPIWLSLSFFGIIILIQTIIQLPFAYYETFVIEEKFGFNKMTKKLFVIDTIKSIFLTMILGWLISSIIIYIYSIFWTNFWILAWIFMTCISMFMMMFYSTLIVPLFNKQTPLEDWELKTAINNFAEKVGFKLDNIFVIDGSKRSSKANAYFSGIGAKKRIVLYDTLINDLTTDELVWVLAHEIGHYKKKHVWQMLSMSIIQTGFMLFLLSLMINNLEIAKAMWAQNTSFHIWMIAFSLLFTPISLVLGILSSIMSRKNEYEADNFAKTNFDWKELINALKRLSINNLSNLRPHRIYEFIHYSHPTVLKRIANLEK